MDIKSHKLPSIRSGKKKNRKEEGRVVHVRAILENISDRYCLSLEDAI